FSKTGVFPGSVFVSVSPPPAARCNRCRASPLLLDSRHPQAARPWQAFRLICSSPAQPVTGHCRGACLSIASIPILAIGRDKYQVRC
ncbi:hypothetical protein GQ607_017415, partial [Colletotrichum asianum]